MAAGQPRDSVGRKEHHRSDVMKSIALIPSRLNSTRLPSKALLDIDGLPLIVHTLRRAQLAKSIDDVYVCTDSDAIFKVVEEHGGKALRTGSHHFNGTDRIAEAMAGLSADLVVDVQGDEPLIDPDHIDAVVAEHQRHPEWDIVVPTLAIAQPESPHLVKIVHDSKMRIVLMSRAVIPHPFRQRPPHYLKHLSIISFTPVALARFASLPQSPLEIIEGVELLRAIENGMVIGTLLLDGASLSIDVQDDYVRAQVQMSRDRIRKRY
jgi:3-deoxy-manno-octulosonate cytidylyltransferase (CMP-KDO synthetase)